MKKKMREYTVGTWIKRTISLPEEQASYIDALVDSGSYASASEVVRAGLRALQAMRDAAASVAARLSVSPVYDLGSERSCAGSFLQVKSSPIFAIITLKIWK